MTDQTLPISRILLRGSTMRVIAFLFNVLATLIVMPILIEGLGPRGYGMWATIGSLVAYYGMVDLGLAATNEKFMAQRFAEGKPEKAASIFSTSLFIFGGIGLVFAAITVIVSYLAPAFFVEPDDIRSFRWTFLILGLNFALTLPFYAVEGALSAKLVFTKVAASRMIIALVRTLAIVVLARNGLTILSLSALIVAVSFFQRGMLVYLLYTEIPFLLKRSLRFSKTEAKLMYNHGKYVFLGNISSNAHFRLSNVIVASIIGLGAVTYYSVASRLAEYLQQFVRSLFSTLLPVFSSMDVEMSDSEFRYFFWQTFQLNIVITVFLAGLALVLGKAFIFLWLGPGFEESYVVFVILSLGLTFKQMQRTSVSALMAKSRHKNNNLVEVVESALSVALAIVLGQIYGLYGIAVGIIMPMIVSKVIVQPVIQCRDLGLSLKTYYAYLIRYSIPVALTFIPAWWIVQRMEVTDLFALCLAGAACLLLSTPVALWSLPGHLRSKILNTASRPFKRVNNDSGTS